MNFKLIMENWGRFIDSLDEQTDVAAGAGISKGNVEAITNINKISQKDPELGVAIRKLSPKEIKKSMLFYDGSFLYWMIDGKPIQKWGAKSGSYEIMLDTKVKARIILDVIKKMQSKKPEDEIIRDLRMFVEPRDIPEFKSGVFIRSQDAKNLYSAFKLKNRKEIMKNFRLIFDRYINDEYMGADEKRSVSSKKNAGPIPEGEYGIFHKLQELPSHKNANPSIYDTLYLAMAEYTGKAMDSDDPAERISKEEFKNAIEKNMSVVDAKSEKDAERWLKIVDAIKWGNFRIRITKLNARAKRMMKEKGAGYDKRDGFLIHGGAILGSAGCIDLGDEIDSFAKFWTVAGVGKAVVGGGRPGSLQSAGFKIPLIVKYNDDAKENLISNDRVADRFSDTIFK